MCIAVLTIFVHFAALLRIVNQTSSQIGLTLQYWKLNLFVGRLADDSVERLSKVSSPYMVLHNTVSNRAENQILSGLLHLCSQSKY